MIANVEAERSVLGSVLAAPELWDETAKKDPDSAKAVDMLTKFMKVKGFMK